MSYNWIEDRDKAFRAIKKIAKELAQEYNFKVVKKGKIALAEKKTLVLKNDTLTIKLFVTRSGPYEIHFFNNNDDTESKNMLSFFLNFFKNDFDKVNRFLKKHYKKSESEFKNKQDFYVYMLRKDIGFLEKEYSGLLKNGDLNIFFKS